MSVTALPVTPAEYRRGALLVTAAIVVWSTAGVLARWVDVDPWTTLFWRSVFAAISLRAYLAFRDGRGMFDGFRRLGRVGGGTGRYGRKLQCADSWRRGRYPHDSSRRSHSP